LPVNIAGLHGSSRLAGDLVIYDFVIPRDRACDYLAVQV